MDQLRLGTAGDPIAGAQADRVRALLEARQEVLASVELVRVASRSPMEDLHALFGLLRDRVTDAVVCPVERLPVVLPRGIVARAWLRDRSSLYRCVTKEPVTLAGLASGARVVTCDDVARAQIRHRYPHLVVESAGPTGDLLDRLSHGVWDAACVPAHLLETASFAGLLSRPVDAAVVIPAVGLGGVAILVLEGWAAAHDLVRELNDPAVALPMHMERMFLTMATGLSDTVCTAQAGQAAECMELTGLIAHKDGRWRVSERMSGPAGQAEEMARSLAASCGRSAAAEKRRDAAA